MAVYDSPDERSDDSPMIAHARQSNEMAIAERPEYHPRMRDVIKAITIEKHGEQTRKEQQEKYSIEEECLALIAIHPQISIISALIAEKRIGNRESDKIHDSIPSDREAAYHIRTYPLRKFYKLRKHSDKCTPDGFHRQD